MNKETLRMQMLAGVITESEYKEKLENLNEAPLAAVAIASLPLVASLVIGFEYDKAIKNLFNKAREIRDDRKREREIARIKQVKAEIEKETAEIKASPEYAKAQADTELQSLIKQYNDSIEFNTIGDEQAGDATTFGNKNEGFAKKILAKISTEYPSLKKVIEREILADLKNTISTSRIFKLEEKDSLNEHYVAGGMVGLGAINQIPSRAKADYEDAFEYFLSQKYPLNETELEEIGVGGAVLGGAAIAALAKKAYGAYKNYALKKGMKETGEEKKGSNGIIAKEYMSEKDGKTYWGITYQDDTRDSGYEKPRMFLFTPEKIDKVLNTDLKFATSDEDMMADGADQKLGQFIADKVVMLEGEEESYNY